MHASPELNDLTAPTRATDRRTIVVGYDGSSSSTAAVEWAATEVVDRKATVRVVTCLGVPHVAHSETPACPDLVPVCQAAVRMLAAEEDSDVRVPPVEFSLDVVYGSAWKRLVIESYGSELLVIGTAGHLLLGAWRLGAVAHELLRHAPCPVVLVPVGQPLPKRNRIVVGVDRATSGVALAWAADEAERRRAELLIVHAWTPTPPDELGHRDPHDSARVDAESIIQEATRRAAERCTTHIASRLMDGRPAPALLAQAFNADLLVIGSRPNGHGSEHPGSVTRAVAACATGPTVVVRPDLGRPFGPSDT